jgi:hypothetical protein
MYQTFLITAQKHVSNQRSARLLLKSVKNTQIPGPGENFSLKLLIYDLPDGYSESYIFTKKFS